MSGLNESEEFAFLFKRTLSSGLWRHSLKKERGEVSKRKEESALRRTWSLYSRTRSAKGTAFIKILFSVGYVGTAEQKPGKY